ncbi:MAG TPA: hypothetical protein VM243_10965, partial [Phycisphaerae bacterium]|nr:hypothetical protein [Phycisphaerae bacterium]
LGLPRIDPGAFWRAVRRGAADGELVRGVKPATLLEFRRCFDDLLESDASLDLALPHADVAAALGTLGRAGECHLVSIGRNRAARQRQLDAHNLSVHFTRMSALRDDRAARQQQLRQLADGDPRAVVAAAGEPTVRAAEAAGLLAVGVASGACTAARFRRAGARCVFADLTELAADVAAGATALTDAGLLPAPAVSDHPARL